MDHMQQAGELVVEVRARRDRRSCVAGKRFAHCWPSLLQIREIVPDEPGALRCKGPVG
jgi:hypothetical protein